MRKTIPASTALGMSASSPVKNSVNSSTTAAIVRLASWVRPFCSSRICVLVGLPLTTKVPLRPAARLAPLSPTMSRLMSTASPCLNAKLREVAALWAMMSTKQDRAVGSTLGTSDQEMPDGRPIGGKPPCTAPTTATPCALCVGQGGDGGQQHDGDDGTRDDRDETLEDPDDHDRGQPEGERGEAGSRTAR